MATGDEKLPCLLLIEIPLPSRRLALSALRALQVDAELSSLVHRSLSLTSLLPDASDSSSLGKNVEAVTTVFDQSAVVLRIEYKATTDRMLRVAVNGFMESLNVVLGVIEELDVDVLEEAG